MIDSLHIDNTTGEYFLFFCIQVFSPCHISTSKKYPLLQFVLNCRRGYVFIYSQHRSLLNTDSIAVLYYTHRCRGNLHSKLIKQLIKSVKNISAVFSYTFSLHQHFLICYVYLPVFHNCHEIPYADDHLNISFPKDIQAIQNIL